MENKVSRKCGDTILILPPTLALYLKTYFSFWFIIISYKLLYRIKYYPELFVVL